VTSENGGLEAALSALDAEVAAYNQALNQAKRAAARAKGAIDQGIVRDVPSSLAALESASSALAEAAAGLRAAWQFDVDSWFASGAYAKELVTSAAELGVKAFESDERILCYPTIVQVSTTDTSVLIDKKRERGVRPSVVVAHLKKMSEREPKFRPDAFIETLAAAYDLVVAQRSLRPGAPAKLVDVYAVLTLMPGAARDYTKPEFARDIYLLDQSGVIDTKKGRRMSLPASALTRSASAVLRTVTRSGQAKDYAGISFEEPQS
jgi:hypothetical protein